MTSILIKKLGTQVSEKVLHLSSLTTAPLADVLSQAKDFDPIYTPTISPRYYSTLAIDQVPNELPFVHIVTFSEHLG